MRRVEVMIRIFPIRGTSTTDGARIDVAAIKEVVPSFDDEYHNKCCVVRLRRLPSYQEFPDEYQVLGLTADELRVKIDRITLGFDDS